MLPSLFAAAGRQRRILLRILICSAMCGAPSAVPAAETVFHNNYPHSMPDAGDFLRWSWQRAGHAAGRRPVRALATVPPALDFVQHNRTAPAITFIGHSTLLVQLAAINVLTDPMFSERASPAPFAGPKRWQAPGLAIAQLPHIDVIVISHNHYDHLDVPSLRGLCAQAGGAPRFLLPLGLTAWLRKAVPECAAAVAEDIGWWDERTLDGVRFVLTPVQHWSSRTLFDRNRTLWGGWALFAADFRFWFSGDLGYSRDTADIGARLGPFDVAAIAIGAYEPRWFMHSQHINPEEAVQVQQAVRAARAIGIHWGTFVDLADERLDQPIDDLAAAREKHRLPADRFITLAPGETRRWQDGGLLPVRP